MAKSKSNKLSGLVRATDMPSTAYKPSAAELAERHRYQAEDALRTITRAEENQVRPAADVGRAQAGL